MNIGFIGLGRMGIAMARNLAKAGHAVTVWNRSGDKAASLEQDGAIVAPSVRAVAVAAEVIFTMLGDDAAEDNVVFGADGLAASMQEGTIHISSSTISTAMAQRLAGEHEKRGQHYLSAPVFGRPDVAAAARLLVAVAGPRDAIQRARPLFDAIARQTFIAGDEPWQANLIKLCANFTLFSMLETLGEAVALVRKAGIEASAFMDPLIEVFGSPVYRNYGGMIANDRFEPAGFALRLALKDARLLLTAADELDAPLPLASLVHDQLLAAMANGQSELDCASLARIAARNAGV